MTYRNKESGDFTRTHFKPVTIINPTNQPIPVVASIPHSGTFIPDNLKPLFQDNILETLPSTDWYIHELYDFLPSLGVTVIKAEFSRYVADPNRPLPKADVLNTDFNHHPVFTKTVFGNPIYKDHVERKTLQVKDRLLNYYVPYHNALDNALTQTVKRFGTAYLLDLHSFTYNIDAHICLGTYRDDRRSTAPRLHQIFMEHCKLLPLKLVTNRVFKGGHVTRNTRLRPFVEAMQIEIIKGCYLQGGHNKVYRPNKSQPNFDNLRNILRQILERTTRQLSDRKRAPRS